MREGVDGVVAWLGPDWGEWPSVVDHSTQCNWSRAYGAIDLTPYVRSLEIFTSEIVNLGDSASHAALAFEGFREWSANITLLQGFKSALAPRERYLRRMARLKPRHRRRSSR